MTPQKYAYIDLMRACAILLVLMVHVAQLAGPQSSIPLHVFAFGQMGVQLFYVASALTLCLSMSARKNDSHYVKSFYVRRLFRIAPLYYLGIATYGVTSLLYGSHTAYPRATLYDIFMNIFFVHGLNGHAMNSVVPGGWSIGCEMLFYSFFPFLFMMLTTLRRAWIFLGVTLTLAILFNIGFSIFTGRPLGFEINTPRYFFIINQLPVFAWGFILYLMIRDKILEPFSTAAFWGLSAVALVVGVILLAVWGGHLAGPITSCFVPFLGGFFFACVGLLFKHLPQIPGIFVTIGRQSYSWYLFHFSVVWFCVYPLNSFGWFSGLNGIVRFVIAFLLTTTICLIVGGIIGKLIERPGVALGESLIRRFFMTPEKRAV